MTDRYSRIVYIGRFQPFHNGHLFVLRQALSMAERVIIVIGSGKTSPNIRNPFPFRYRRLMILESLTAEEQDRVDICLVEDYLYNDEKWIRRVQEEVSNHPGNKIGATAIIGHHKDETSYYLDAFPQWEAIEIGNYEGINATDIRNELYENGPDSIMYAPVPDDVKQLVIAHAASESFCNVQEEYEFIKRYKASWKHSPFPPHFITVDAVAVRSGHVLMVQRGQNPGKGLYALPGGFVDTNERIRDAATRELIEETRIDEDFEGNLDHYIVRNHYYDAPARSLRGRTVTHGFLYELGHGPLPTVVGADDATKALWVSLDDLEIIREEIMEDHYDIINHLIGL